MQNDTAYREVREAFRVLEYVGSHFGSPLWNPRGDRSKPGNTLVVKPKWVSHKSLGYRIYGQRYNESFYLPVIPRSSATRIKGIRIQLRDWICCLSPSSCGGATHAPSALLRGAPPPFDSTRSYKIPQIHRTSLVEKLLFSYVRPKEIEVVDLDRITGIKYIFTNGIVSPCEPSKWLKGHVE